MVVLQNDPAAMMMASRVVARPKLDFDSNRDLGFKIRSISTLAKRPYNFESFRMLHYDIIIEDAVSNREKAKELNIQGVKLYKEGKLDEAQWMFQKALSIDQSYENAQKNLDTLNAKVSARNARMNKEAKEGKSFAEVKKEISRENAERTGPVAAPVEYQVPVAEVYQGPSREQHGYAQDPYQQAAYQQAGYQQARETELKNPNMQKNYKCPGCSIPVKGDWVMCTNCGTDLRQYPPIP